MWTNPVARITPAAKALIIKNMSLSGLSASIFLPNCGRLTPIPPATSIEAMAASLNLRDALLLLSLEASLSHVEIPKARGKGSVESKKFKKRMLMDDLGRKNLACFVGYIYKELGINE